jgi:site-specific recombinase XerD
MLRRRGMIDPAEERAMAVRQSPIVHHLAAFERSLDDTTPRHRKLTMMRVRRLIEGSEAQILSDLSAEKVQNASKKIGREEDLGARTYNHYRQAVDEFGKWLDSTHRLPSNLLAGTDRLNAETDVRHKRRALTPEEVSRLVEAARLSGCDVQGYSGEMRARVYLMSFFNGLWRLELGSLTPRSLRLDDSQPTLVVEAACSKHRRKDVLPMHPELVALVREWIAGLEPDEPLFPRLARKKTYSMVRKNLERAAIPYETHDGLADFNDAGRHSHVTGLIAPGASIMEAKELARHSDIRQTAKYTHIGMRARVEALAGLQYPKTCEIVELSEIRRVSGGVVRQKVSRADSYGDREGGSENEKTPSREGVSSFPVADFQNVSADASDGGGGNCTRVPALASGSDRCLSETALSIGRRMPQPRREYDGQQDHRASSCQPAKDGSDRSERAGSARSR